MSNLEYLDLLFEQPFMSPQFVWGLSRVCLPIIVQYLIDRNSEIFPYIHILKYYYPNNWWSLIIETYLDRTKDIFDNTIDERLSIKISLDKFERIPEVCIMLLGQTFYDQFNDIIQSVMQEQYEKFDIDKIDNEEIIKLKQQIYNLIDKIKNTTKQKQLQQNIVKFCVVIQNKLFKQDYKLRNCEKVLNLVQNNSKYKQMVQDTKYKILLK
ncbi:Hypothetical_protein [Hexamita inflata]|uniref:Hypothetical_protein n=1 Tax=Hexamita inflata TaxID=28002 RepID=A0AA86P7V7_9EUKA|nr:Hypothetical protein HINF_LOCUS20096 [Hexamita inflata]